MFEILALICLLAAPVLLVVLSVIDLRVRLLPNVYNAALALCALLFHGLTGFAYLSPAEMMIGAAIGAGLLYGIRLIANRLYNQDTLGLGDVKLMGAAGLWLGPEMILSALIIGALAGVAHGIGVMLYGWIKTKKKTPLASFSIPAGPGFAVGIFLAGLAKYAPFVESLF